MFFFFRSFYFRSTFQAWNERQDLLLYDPVRGCVCVGAFAVAMYACAASVSIVFISPDENFRQVLTFLPLSVRW